MRSKELTALIATMLICLGLAGCSGSSSTNPVDTSNLYALKTDFVGDNSAVSRIASAVPYPAQAQYDSIVIQSKSTPYGLTVRLANGSDVSANNLFKSSATTFALIGNMGRLTYDDAQTHERIATYTREQVNEALQQQQQPSIKELNSTESVFKDYVGAV